MIWFSPDGLGVLLDVELTLGRVSVLSSLDIDATSRFQDSKA